MHESGAPSIVDQALKFLDQGGIAMGPLVGLAFLLWFALGYRFFVVRRGAGGPLERVLERAWEGAAPAPRGSAGTRSGTG